MEIMAFNVFFFLSTCSGIVFLMHSMSAWKSDCVCLCKDLQLQARLSFTDFKAIWTCAYYNIMVVKETEYCSQSDLLGLNKAKETLTTVITT